MRFPAQNDHFLFRRYFYEIQSTRVCIRSNSFRLFVRSGGNNRCFLLWQSHLLRWQQLLQITNRKPRSNPGLSSLRHSLQIAPGA
jgi:hypothetical protein